MSGRSIQIILLSMTTALVTGCAQNRFSVATLPARYAVTPTQDYSSLDLTVFAKRNADEDLIRRGDRLQVNLNTGTLADDSEHVWKVSVDESGQTSLPNIGAVRLAGLTRSEAEKSIIQTSLERDVFLTPVVEVSLETRKERNVTVTGAVKTPGPVMVTGRMTDLATVIVRAGGLTEDASGTISLSSAVVEPNPVVGIENEIRPLAQTSLRSMEISLAKTRGSELGRIMIPEGSMIHVESHAPRRIQVIGVIRNQAVDVPAGRNVRLLDALTLAGGPTYSNWISDRVTVIRRDPAGKNTIRIKASIRRAKRDDQHNLLLAPFDIVSVEENALTFTLSTLSGFIGAGANVSRGLFIP